VLAEAFEALDQPALDPHAIGLLSPVSGGQASELLPKDRLSFFLAGA